MSRIALLLLPVICAMATGAQAALRIELDGLDAASVAAKVRLDDGKPGPYQYGLATEITAAVSPASRLGPGTAWEKSGGASARLRIEVVAEGATSLDFGFKPFRLPSGGEMWITGADGRSIGPYSDADNSPRGLYTPLVAGDRAAIEITVPSDRTDRVDIQLVNVTRGFRDPFGQKAAPPQPKSDACNVDVICPQGDTWRQPIGSVAAYLFSGFACTGQLVTDSAQNRARGLFTTANHCVDSDAEAAQMVFYWRYESNVCRTPGSAESGNSLPRSIAAATQGGARLLARHPGSDFTLVQLDDPVPDAAQAFLSGWDRAATSSTQTATIHHPSGHEKRISLENDPVNPSVDRFQAGSIDLAPGFAWYVSSWDQGTTEPGSSGSGLWNQDRRFIGVLSGGSAGCGNFDYYGRLQTAWEGGGTAATRMRDWLDPLGTNPTAVNGTFQCDGPTVTLDSAAFQTLPAAGETITFTATATGGGGGAYAFAFDLDGDGIAERTQSSGQVSVSYPMATSMQVGVTVTGANACPRTVTRGLDVRGPAITASPQSAQQLCGDNDTAIEPGEHWRLPVTLRNQGSATLVGNGFALFAPGTGGVDALPTQAVDNDFGPLDDARTVDPIATGSGGGLLVYGQRHAQAVMSTNGYLSVNPAESGGDFSNGCNGDVNNGSFAPRLHVLHDDLVVDGAASGAGLRYAYFVACPRAAESGSAGGCHVFQWSGMSRFQSSATQLGEFQAVVYDNGQITYQYAQPDPAGGSQATIGTVNASQTSVLNVGCNQSGVIAAGSSACIFPPGIGNGRTLPIGPDGFGYRAVTSLQDAAGCGFDYIDLKAGVEGVDVTMPNAAIAMPSLAVNASTTANVDFHVPQGATCGQALGLEYVGTATPSQSSPQGTTVLATSVGNGGSCQIANCPVPTPPVFQPRYGMYYQHQRSGNGLLNYVYPSSNPELDGDFGGIWYTALADRSPTWYIVAGPVRDRLAVADVLRFGNSAAPGGFAPVAANVGRAWVAQPETDRVVFAWDIEGSRSIELLGNIGLGFSAPNRSQQWYPPSQSGWGSAIESNALPDGGYNEFWALFFYDAIGIARWVIGTDNDDMGSFQTNAFRVHCPGCVYYPDQLTLPLPAGSMSRSFQSLNAATVSTQFVLPADFGGSWTRSNVPFVPFATPIQ